MQKDKTSSSEAHKIEITDNTLIYSSEDANIKYNKETVVDDKNQTVTERETIEVVDSTKPGSITDSSGKKTELNNAKKTTEKTTQKNITQKKETEQSELQSTTQVDKKEDLAIKIDTEKEAAEIHVDKNPFNLWNLLWLLIPLGIIIYIFKNRKVISEKIKNIWWF